MIAAFLLGNRATAQESKKEQPAKPLAGYSVLVVEKFKVEPPAVKAGFLEAQVPVMQAEIVLQLVKKRIFERSLVAIARRQPSRCATPGRKR